MKSWLPTKCRKEVVEVWLMRGLNPIYLMQPSTSSNFVGWWWLSKIIHHIDRHSTSPTIHIMYVGHCCKVFKHAVISQHCWRMFDCNDQYGSRCESSEPGLVCVMWLHRMLTAMGLLYSVGKCFTISSESHKPIIFMIIEWKCLGHRWQVQPHGN